MTAISEYSLKAFVSVGIARVCALALIAVSGFLSGCSNESSGTIAVNQTDGIVLYPPEFLLRRNINQENLAVRAYLHDEVNNVRYNAMQTNTGTNPWVGNAINVPEGLKLSINVVWEETEVEDLPDEENGVLALAIYYVHPDDADWGPIDISSAVDVQIAEFSTQSNDAWSPDLPSLDMDNDGASNFDERVADTDPNDGTDTPPPSQEPEVLIRYSDQGPVIDGIYDSLWEPYAQFQDQNSNSLGFGNAVILPDDGSVDPAMANDFKWGAIHDGQYLYLYVAAESGSYQTPNSDSEEAYQDDSVDVYVDGDLSGGFSYDGVDDFHVTIGLLSENGGANNSSEVGGRMEVVVPSVTIDDLSVIQYAVCLCPEGQRYEIRLDLAALKIPVGTTFGFELDINNDVNGGERDAKWAWSNDTGEDDTYRYPALMGTVRLEPAPNLFR